MAKSPLRVLADILSDAVDHIDARFAAEKVPFPTLDDFYEPNAHPGNVLITDAVVVEQAKLVVAAAEQLCAMVRDPVSVVMDMMLQHHKASGLSVVVNGNVAEILREAGPQGLHVEDIAKRNGMDAKRLSRVLRSLASYHTFTEVSPEVFTHNRVSLVLDTKKPVSGLTCPPKGNKYTGTNGIAAFLGHTADDIMKGSAVLADHLCDPETRLLNVPTITPLGRAFNMKSVFFEWMAQPGNEDRQARFQAAMVCMRNAEEVVTPNGFPWKTLKPGSKVVDVGGGLGMVSMEIAKKFPKLKFIIQDIPSISAQATEFWNEQIPGSIESGQVAIQAHNFFKSQPVKDADIFLLRAIIHDWPTSFAVDVLKKLREVAVPGKTKLLLMETVLGYACKDLPAGVDEIQGIDKLVPSAPEPLLPNLGRGGGWANHLDLSVLVLLNGQERMIGEHIHVCKEAGWKITHLYTPGTPLYRQLLAEPI